MSDFEMDLLDNGSDDSEGSSQSEKEAANSHTEICLFGNTTVELPLELVESVGTTHMICYVQFGFLSNFLCYKFYYHWHTCHNIWHLNMGTIS